jgi:hypothetical protein
MKLAEERDDDDEGGREGGVLCEEMRNVRNSL